MNPNIIEKMKNAIGGSGADPPRALFDIDPSMTQIYAIRSYILEKNVRIRMFLILGLKQITWYSELKDKFDIHPSHITEFFDYMKENSMILFKPLVEVENILFDSVITQNTYSFYSQRDTVKVYTLTPLGNELFEKILNDLIKLCNERPDLKLYVNEIMTKTETHRYLLGKLKDKETKEFKRLIKYPDGLEVEVETEREREYKKDLLEFKQQLLLSKEVSK